MRTEESDRSLDSGGAQGLARSAAAFTLLELLVVIAIIGILAAMLMPALDRAKQRAQGAQCLANGRQMMTAIILYANENHDFFPPNPDDANTDPGYNWCSGNAGIDGPQEFDPDVLKDPTRSLLIAYLSGNITVFHCPADPRQGKYQGSDPAFSGKTVPAARTFSMNQAIGTIDPGFDAWEFNRTPPKHSGIPDMSVNGPWLDDYDGGVAHHRNSPWATYGKTSAIGAPGPSMLWVLVDENPGGLNDAAFAFEMLSPSWIDAPGSYHNGACGFAFADGHSEIHQWIERAVDHSDANETDWDWMQARTSARVGQSP
jgi:prepilin-type N-terminal cleavage/methylation domain-containing protein/prepilin-type processing-associated H-X9-DG protein